MAQTFALPPPSKESLKDQLPLVEPNMLPCSIQHDGPVPVSRRYWDPVCDEENEDQATAYFRGRRLRGKRVLIPEGYYGLLVAPPTTTPESRDQQQQQKRYQEPDLYGDECGYERDGDGEEEKQQSKTTLLTPHSAFTHIQIWGHEQLPVIRDDVFSRGVSEWIRFAEKIHMDDPSPASSPSTKETTAPPENTTGCTNGTTLQQERNSRDGLADH